MELEGKVAVITGGKRIGRVVARELARRGMDMVLSYRGSKQEADATAADVEAAGRHATTISGDVSRPADCQAIVEHAAATFGRIDVLINMASIYRSTPLADVTVEVLGHRPQRQPAIGVSLRAGGDSAHARAAAGAS